MYAIRLQNNLTYHLDGEQSLFICCWQAHSIFILVYLYPLTEYNRLRLTVNTNFGMAVRRCCILCQFRLVKFRARFFRLGYSLSTQSVSCVRGLLVRFKNLKPGITSRSVHTWRNNRIAYIGGGIDILICGDWWTKIMKTCHYNDRVVPSLTFDIKEGTTTNCMTKYIKLLRGIFSHSHFLITAETLPRPTNAFK